MSIICPSEDAEEICLTEYCDKRGLTHWHVPQETYTTSWKQKALNKAKGVLAGVSDHWIILPTKDWGTILLVAELKRQHGNVPTDEQIDFIHKIDKVDNVVPFCAYGAQEVIDVVEELERGDDSTLTKCEQRLEKIYRIRQNRPKTAKKSQKTPKKRDNRDDLPPAENGSPF